MELVCINKYETCQMWKLLLIIWVVRHVCPNLSTVANRLADNVRALGWTFLMSSPGTAAQKSCYVEGNKKKLIDACPALNKSQIEKPLLEQDNVLPA